MSFHHDRAENLLKETNALPAITTADALAMAQAHATLEVAHAIRRLTFEVWRIDQRRKS